MYVLRKRVGSSWMVHLYTIHAVNKMWELVKDMCEECTLCNIIDRNRSERLTCNWITFGENYYNVSAQSITVGAKRWVKAEPIILSVFLLCCSKRFFRQLFFPLLFLFCCCTHCCCCCFLLAAAGSFIDVAFR